MSLLPGVKAWTAADDRRQDSRVANLMVKGERLGILIL